MKQQKLWGNSKFVVDDFKKKVIRKFCGWKSKFFLKR